MCYWWSTLLFKYSNLYTHKTHTKSVKRAILYLDTYTHTQMKWSGTTKVYKNNVEFLVRLFLLYKIVENYTVKIYIMAKTLVF